MGRPYTQAMTVRRQPTPIALPFLLAAAVALGVVGCTTNGTHPEPAHTAAAPAVHKAPASGPSGVIATASLSSTDNAISGTVSVSANDLQQGAANTLTVTVSNFRSTEPAGTTISIVTYPAGTSCIADQFALDLGNLTNASTQAFLFGANSTPAEDDPTGGDPSLYRTIVVGAPEAPAPDGGCIIQPLAEATLTWTIPHLPSIFAAVDTGPAPQAMGTTTLVGGKPVSYQVAPNDTIAAVAKRFKITVNALLYVDPAADLPNPWATLPPGERITFAKATK
jgi:LysM repeat protein